MIGIREIRMPDINKLFDGLDQASIAKVRLRAQNALAAKAKTLANKTARERYAVPASLLRDAMFIVKAIPSDLSATLKVTGARTSTSKFRRTPSLPNWKAQQRRPGTAVKIFTSQSPVVFKGAFTAQMPKSGHVAVFRRLPGKAMRSRPGKEEIAEQKVIGPAEMVQAKPVMTAIRILIANESPIIYERELRYAMETATATVRIE